MTAHVARQRLHRTNFSPTTKAQKGITIAGFRAHFSRSDPRPLRPGHQRFCPTKARATTPRLRKIQTTCFGGTGVNHSLRLMSTQPAAAKKRMLTKAQTGSKNSQHAKPSVTQTVHTLSCRVVSGGRFTSPIKQLQRAFRNPRLLTVASVTLISLPRPVPDRGCAGRIQESCVSRRQGRESACL